MCICVCVGAFMRILCPDDDGLSLSPNSALWVSLLLTLKGHFMEWGNTSTLHTGRAYKICFNEMQRLEGEREENVSTIRARYIKRSEVKKRIAISQCLTTCYW